MSSTTLNVERGCLVIADISGYTGLLMQAELDHAESALNNLLGTVVDEFQPVLTLSKLEGDAAFAYVLAGSFGASTLLDTIDRTYDAFRRRLRDVSTATSCPCRACTLIPSLDLKFVVHDGEFVRRGEELVGRDVIVVHRLLKNDAAQKLGTRGYLLLTQPCVDVLGIDAAELGFTQHEERYEDVGEVGCWLLDLGKRWQEEIERIRVRVPSEGASFERSWSGSVAPEELWEWLTSPSKRCLWQADQVLQVVGAGRIAPGTTNHCMHGEDVSVEEVLDWRPFEYYSLRYEFPGVGKMTWTTELGRNEEGETTVTIRGEGFPDEERRAAWEQLAPYILPMVEGMGARLLPAIEAEKAGAAA